MTPATEVCEVEEAIRGVIGMESRFSLSALRPYAGCMRAITVVANKEDAELLIRKKKIRIGLTMCLMEERAEIKKCKRCWSPTHLAKECTKEDRRSWCYKCGEPGHLTGECKNDPKCPDCQTSGHRASTGTCPIYREKIKKMKMKRAEGKNDRPEIAEHKQVKDTIKETENIQESTMVEEDKDQEEENVSDESRKQDQREANAEESESTKTEKKEQGKQTRKEQGEMKNFEKVSRRKKRKKREGNIEGQSSTESGSPNEPIRNRYLRAINRDA
nr:protein SREK1IP1-like [Onthophagus taurus]